MSRKEKIDFYLKKVISRKLLAWVVGTVALFLGSLDGDNWVVITTVYISLQGATDIVERLKKTN